MSTRFSLDHLRALSIQGLDAVAFAQSQFTANIDRLARSTWSPLAWCDSKGRAIGFMMGRMEQDRVDLAITATLADGVRERLQRFTIGRRVDMPEPAPLAGTFDVDDHDTATLSVDRERGMLAGVQADSDPETLSRWQRLDVCAGLPWLGPGSSERHLPQWLGLETLGGLVYDKGCYPGQEVIARLHYRGSIKHRLRGLEIHAAGQFSAHTRITDPDGLAVGHWLGGVPLAGRSIGLAVLKADVADGSEVVIQEDDISMSAQVTPPETLC